jgi:hypothetical protein
MGWIFKKFINYIEKIWTKGTIKVRSKEKYPYLWKNYLLVVR